MKRAVFVAAAVGLGSLSAAAVAALPAGAATAPASAPVRCDEGHWPLTVQGEPRNFNPGDPAGYRIWHDASGWHLRTTTPREGETVFRGVIHSADDLVVVNKVSDEPADQVHVGDKTIVFELHTHDHVDGIDFRVGCTDHVTFELQANGQQVPAERIWLGKVGRAPSNPFTVSRRP